MSDGDYKGESKPDRPEDERVEVDPDIPVLTR